MLSIVQKWYPRYSECWIHVLYYRIKHIIQYILFIIADFLHMLIIDYTSMYKYTNITNKCVGIAFKIIY